MPINGDCRFVLNELNRLYAIKPNHPAPIQVTPAVASLDKHCTQPLPQTRL